MDFKRQTKFGTSAIRMMRQPTKERFSLNVLQLPTKALVHRLSRRQTIRALSHRLISDPLKPSICRLRGISRGMASITTGERAHAKTKESRQGTSSLYLFLDNVLFPFCFSSLTTQELDPLKFWGITKNINPFSTKMYLWSLTLHSESLLSMCGNI